MSVAPRIVFWQNFVSPHQREFVAAVAATGVAVTLVVDSVADSDRAKLGWSFSPPPGITLVEAPTPRQIHDLLRLEIEQTWHICSFSRAYRSAWTALNLGAKLGCKLVIYSEYFDRAGLKGKIRRWRGALDRLRFGGRIRGVMAIGGEGVRWFRDVGYPDEKLFEFGYFVGHGRGGQPEAPPLSSTYRLCYAGRLVRDKGVDLVIAAVHAVAGSDLHCTIIGDGPERCALEQLSRAGPGSDRIRFAGQMNHAETIALIAEHDALVLPSRGKDGWGVVVNEALLHGLYVGCSQLCGAATLLDDASRGRVVPPDDLPALQRLIHEEVARDPAFRIARRALIADWARAHISVAAGAEYLRRILDYLDQARTLRPPAPWRMKEEKLS